MRTTEQKMNQYGYAVEYSSIVNMWDTYNVPTQWENTGSFVSIVEV